jgi:hypothetical protein
METFALDDISVKCYFRKIIIIDQYAVEESTGATIILRRKH